jgi:bla regulator protein blaR1
MSLLDVLSERVVQAVCLTLVHSLWQGIVLAILTAFIVLATKQSTAVRRYSLLVGSLCVFTLSFLITLIIELSRQNTGDLWVSLTAFVRPSAISGMLNFCIIYCREHAAIVVDVWMLIIAMRCLYLLFGLYSLERIKRMKVKSAGTYWDERVARLARAMGVGSAVALLESGIIKIPMVAGYLKPVILIPASLLTGLRQQEIEMILLHELAHILRKDYLVNILQSLVETLFFFNPAVIWLSWLIRTERENCCDDLVINHTKNQNGYIKALIYYEYSRAGIPAYATAFSGTGTGTLRRLQRIISNRNHSLHELELFGLALFISVGVLFATFHPVQGYDLSREGKLISNEKSAIYKSEFEAKRKAEAEAISRLRSSHNR